MTSWILITNISININSSNENNSEIIYNSMWILKYCQYHLATGGENPIIIFYQHPDYLSSFFSGKNFDKITLAWSCRNSYNMKIKKYLKNPILVYWFVCLFRVGGHIYHNFYLMVINNDWLMIYIELVIIDKIVIFTFFKSCRLWFHFHIVLWLKSTVHHKLSFLESNTSSIGANHLLRIIKL